MRAYKVSTLLVVAVAFLAIASPASSIQDKNIAISRVTATNAVLAVKTDIISDVTVDYGFSPGAYTYSKASPNRSRHEVLLDNLAASSNIYYRVTISATGNPLDSLILSEKSFATTKAAGVPFSYSVIGDNRPPWTDPVTQPAVWSTIVGQLALESLDLVLHAGDIIYGSHTDSPAQAEQKYDEFLSITSSLTGTVPMYTAVGNHEWIHYAVPRAAYEEEFTLPVNNGTDAATDGEMYYSFDNGDTHFIVLCTELPGDIGMVRGNQKAWLEQDLSSTEKKWIVVNMHRPFFSEAHPTDPWVDPTNAVGQQNRAELQNLFKNYGVDVVFVGHDHFYLHHVEDGIQYVISGGAGSPLYVLPLFGPGDIFGSSTYHHVKVDETAASMKLTAIDSAGLVLDSFTLGSPSLVLSQTGVYWADYNDWLLGLLSVDYSLGNTGPGDALALSLVHLSATNGVLPFTGVPIALGDLPAGGAATTTLQYLVPPGIGSFRAFTYATCQDWAGDSHEYPGPAPVS